MGNPTITAAQIEAILGEAIFIDTSDALPAASKSAASKAVTFASFKANWPTKIRPVVLAVINFLTLFRLTTYASYVAQVVGFIDLFIGGQLPPA